MSVYEWECVRLHVCVLRWTCVSSVKCNEARASEAVAETRRARISVCPPVMMCRGGGGAGGSADKSGGCVFRQCNKH